LFGAAATGPQHLPKRAASAMHDSRKILDRFSVLIDPEVTIGYPHPDLPPLEIYAEPPILLRKGVYDIEFIGAFTFMGGTAHADAPRLDDRPLLFDRV
jgi:hypothetical protein